MHKRIDELFGQALDKAVPETWTTLSVEQLEKFKEVFAEMLLKDCVQNIKMWEKDSRNHISYIIKNHYGVEV